MSSPAGKQPRTSGSARKRSKLDSRSRQASRAKIWEIGLRRRVTKLSRAASSTLGPRGRNAVLDKGCGSPKSTKDGVTVAEEIELLDKAENMGAKLVKEAAQAESAAAA